ncbi:hypothetical protein ISN44_As07g017980 [Arabidopsis suecica]|uniref:Ribosomal protein L34Ae n=1 Tax=Arabidopsis suecica TaxID=45249 RepID=A0A8T2BPQ2_ARASU|nr:hypothetical protein ISN44_As07g017980 [Arabidopsis suecica]
MMGIVTTKTYTNFDFSNKGFGVGGLKQFVYGNTFIVLDAFWVSFSNLFFFFRVNSDKETSLVVFEKQNTNGSSVYGDYQDQKQICRTQDDDQMESSLVSISKRCEFYSDISSVGFVEEPKAFSFKFHKYSATTVQEEEKKKMVSFSDENTSSMVLEKSESEEEHVKEEMLVYEFMSCGVLKESLVHENLEFDDDDDGFIELNPSLQISNFSYGEEEEEFMQREEEMKMGFDEQEEVYDEFDDGSDSDDDEFEHSDVIEKLKTELRTARTGGLCTILEESETPLEELKPLKIEPKPDQHKDRIAEIHKVYKNYAVKMRKLDVIDSQTMHSISLLKLKDSSKPSRNTGKPPKSSLHQNIWPFKKHKLECDPIERLVKEASRDFETVYVGQVCLSWEMLRWQYDKVLEFDSQVTTYQYNLVAGEFQLFQVLLQRFVENEPFQNSSRVETYLKNRRHFHNFLQIPLVRDDRSSKTNKKCRNEGEFAVKIEMLREIIRESMSVFWEFLCADKDEFTSMMKVSHQTQVSPQDPLDLELLTDIRTDLQKKEKKLKEILRSQSCIVMKLKKNESKSNVGVKDELLIAQIELRLVSRVMNMSKLTTEKLVWCQEKLSRISFNGRKIHIEPSFSLLPC